MGLHHQYHSVTILPKMDGVFFITAMNAENTIIMPIINKPPIIRLADD